MTNTQEVGENLYLLLLWSLSLGLRLKFLPTMDAEVDQLGISDVGIEYVLFGALLRAASIVLESLR